MDICLDTCVRLITIPILFLLLTLTFMGQVRNLCLNVSMNASIIVLESESLRSGTPVKSDVSTGGSVSGYGSGTGNDSGSDKTPPYLPRTGLPCHQSKPHHNSYATLNHHPHPQHSMTALDGATVTYAQLTLPSSGSPLAARFQQQHQQLRHPSNHLQNSKAEVIYSQIDPRMKANNKAHLTVNPYVDQQNPTSWTPLLGGGLNHTESNL